MICCMPKVLIFRKASIYIQWISFKCIGGHIRYKGLKLYTEKLAKYSQNRGILGAHTDMTKNVFLPYALFFASYTQLNHSLIKTVLVLKPFLKLHGYADEILSKLMGRARQVILVLHLIFEFLTKVTKLTSLLFWAWTFLGGGCKICGSVEHLRSACPERNGKTEFGK